jgi:hypothetical protein
MSGATNAMSTHIKATAAKIATITHRRGGPVSESASDDRISSVGSFFGVAPEEHIPVATTSNPNMASDTNVRQIGKQAKSGGMLRGRSLQGGRGVRQSYRVGLVPLCSRGL